MCVDHVGCSCAGKQFADFRAIIEGVDRHRCEELGKAGLTSTVSPNLRNDGMGRMQRDVFSLGSGEELLRCAFVTVNGDQEPCVEDHRPKRLVAAAMAASVTGPASACQSARSSASASLLWVSSASSRKP